MIWESVQSQKRKKLRGGRGGFLARIWKKYQCNKCNSKLINVPNFIQSGQCESGLSGQDQGVSCCGNCCYSVRRGIFEIHANNTNAIPKWIYIKISIIIIQWESVQNWGGGGEEVSWGRQFFQRGRGRGDWKKGKPQKLHYKINLNTKLYPNRTMGKYYNPEGRAGAGEGYKRNKCQTKIILQIKLYLNRTTGKCSKPGSKLKKEKGGTQEGGRISRVKMQTSQIWFHNSSM